MSKKLASGFKMTGFSAKDPVSAFTKHDGPHPVDGIIKSGDGRGNEYVEFDDGSKVYGSWNEVPGVGKNNKIPVEATYPLTTGELYISEEKGSQQAVMLDMEAMQENRVNPEDEQRMPGPRKEQSAGAPTNY
jgi:hypothetical protein